ncbi:hypothetical protein [Kitasatospora sp. NPDC056181]|uniref:hypothetical protein n=1 Tax=Kitasatospora sp. NPDC056181 TaxID=3345737 RepID=UPI0035DF4B80
MDLVHLAERSAAVTGDFLVASATGAATQAGSVVGSAVAQLVMGRLGIEPTASHAVPALQAAPADEQRRSDLAAALREVLARDPGFAGVLGEAVREVDQNLHVVASGQGSFVPVGSPVTASGRGVAVGRDQHNTRVTKRGGALWAAVAVAVAVVATGTTLLVTQDGPEDTLKQQAEQTAADWLRAAFSNDVETMCALTARGESGIGDCRSEERRKDALVAAQAHPATDDEIAFAKAWRVTSSDLPSTNTARVTAVNKATFHGKTNAPMIVHLTHESGEWRVTDAESAGQDDS